MLQVVNQLGQVLDAVNVVMWGRADQRHSQLCMAQSGDEFSHLGGRKLSPFSGLRTLGDLDLQFFSLHQVLGGDSKAA